MRTRITGRLLLKILFVFVMMALLMPFFVMRQPDLPPGTHVVSSKIATPVKNIELLIDSTTHRPDSEGPVVDQVIFDALLAAIRDADEFIVADFFLWNSWCGQSTANHRTLASELADALLEKRRERPDMPILVITDPINRIYGDQPDKVFDSLHQANIPVIFTRLDRMPDSNRLYAPPARFWSMLLDSNPANSASGPDIIPNPFIVGGKNISTGQLTRMLYFKANHRKLLITGTRKKGPTLIITSLNPADGSSIHSNIALKIRGPIAWCALQSELTIAEWSNRTDWVHGGDSLKAKETITAIQTILRSIRERPKKNTDASQTADWPRVQFLTEGAIHKAVIDALYSAQSSDSIDIAMFYLSDRAIVQAIKDAAVRGVPIRIILDPNRDAFGRTKNGIPNRPVAAELAGFEAPAPIQVRWAITDGEQFHTKAMRIVSASPTRSLLLLGSANFTRRNLGNLNLEADILVQNPQHIGDQFDMYFNQLWEDSNKTGPYQIWEESAPKVFGKTILYRFQEWSGASSF